MREIGIVVSYGGSGEKGWRTELELGGGESLDYHHGTAAFGADPKQARFLGGGDFLFSALWLGCVEYLKAKRQESGASPVGDETKVANADEAFGKQMQQEAAQELIEG